MKGISIRSATLARALARKQIGPVIGRFAARHIQPAPRTPHRNSTKAMKKFPLPLTLIVCALRGTLILAAGLMLVQPCAADSGVFTNTGSLNTARYQHTATLLPNGKVLVAGGLDISNNALASAELYDPTSGTWTATGSLATARYVHTATLLPNGKVLVVGGLGNGGGGALASAELYDSAPPVITSPSTATATESQLFVYQVTATGTPTSYTATPLPAGLSFDSDTGILGGNPTNPGTTQTCPVLPAADNGRRARARHKPAFLLAAAVF